MKTNVTKMMTDVGLFAALGFVLDVVQGVICDFLPFWPNGGSVGIAMCCIFVLSLKYGLIGMFGGLITGLLSMMRGVYISPLAAEGGFFPVLLQLGLDYFLAWTAVGLAGLFVKLFQKEENINKKCLWTGIACFVGGIGKYICHFLVGMIYWPNEDTTSQFLYSFLYNGSYMWPSIALCIVLMIIIVRKQPKLLSK